MPSFLTSGGVYYDADYQLNPDDLQVPPRPSTAHHFVNGKWVLPGRQQPQYEYIPPMDNNSGYQQQDAFAGAGIHPLRINPTQPLQVFQVTPAPAPAPVQSPQPAPAPAPAADKHSGDTTITSSTKFQLGVKEVFMTVAFIVSAAVAWRDTNARIIQTEESIARLEQQLKQSETERKALEAKLTGELKVVGSKIAEQTAGLRDLENVVFTQRGKR